MALLYHFWQYRAYFSVRYCLKITPRRPAGPVPRRAERSGRRRPPCAGNGAKGPVGRQLGVCPALKWHVQSDISCYAVSPFVFCLIKRLVRAGQQIFQAGRIFRLCGGGADAYGDAALWQVAAGISAAFHRRAQRFPGLQYLRAAAGEQANEKIPRRRTERRHLRAPP